MESDYMDLLIQYCKGKYPIPSQLVDIKTFLETVNHPEKDNASFRYNVYQYFTGSMEQ